MTIRIKVLFTPEQAHELLNLLGNELTILSESHSHDDADSKAKIKNLDHTYDKIEKAFKK